MKLALNLSAATLAVAAIALSGTAANAQIAYTLTGGGANLVSFNIAAPNVILSTLNFSTAGGAIDSLDAIDFRANGTLYGYSTTNDQVYQISTTTGALSPVGVSATAGVQATTTPTLGMDFNPSTPNGAGTAAQFRIVTGNSENRVFNVVTAAYTALDPTGVAGPAPLTFSTGGAASVVENAYTNNLLGTASAGTVQYAFATNTAAAQASSLYTLNNNGGVLTRVGTGLGVNLNPITTGFDVFTTGGGVNTAYAVFQNDANSNFSSLYTINLTTGTASLVGTAAGSTIGVGQTGLRSLAVTPVVVPEAGTASLVLGAFAALGAGVVVRRRK